MFKPFEICSIRPPTENQSLTFRLTRNCYWNKCTFCPVYKQGARFARRTLDDVRQDIYSAKHLNDRLDELNADSDFSSLMSSQSADEYQNAQKLIEQILDIQGPDADLAGHSIPANDDDPITNWFMQWFRDVPTISDSINHLLAWRMGGRKTCFLGDADSLILKPEFIREVISTVKNVFPSVHRFTVYGRTATAARFRLLSELKEFRKAGLNRVHFGIESGSDTVLREVRKGETKDDHIRGCLKVKDAGLSVSDYVMPGLGGQKYSDEHAKETADVVSQTAPDFVRIRTLQVFPNTELSKQIKNGTFKEASEEQVVAEIRQMIEQIDTQTQIISDSATNLLQINGRLPEDRSAMLNVIESYLALSPTRKKMFSLQARMASFEGQYGGFSRDIYEELAPYIHNGDLDIDSIPESAVDALILLLRSRLMP